MSQTSTCPPGLTEPNNVFEMQNNVSDELNDFQKQYARYIKCQNPDTRENINPPCDFDGSDNFQELTNAYNRLYKSLDEMKEVYSDQVKDGKTNENYEKDEQELEEFYGKMRNLRADLDKKLLYIQNQADIETAPVYRRLNSQILINTLLLILLVYLVYIMIFDIY
tara:strand:- start:1292 stop:1789 length:498 start_codon:yes stop_codon:yes gene_type:complete